MSFPGLSWHRRAACRGTDPELFFPELDGGGEVARRICARCPVTADCLRHAVDFPEHGIWGGRDENERRQLRRNMLRSQRGKAA